MARVVKSSEERTKELLAAAEKLFKKKGYENTTVNDIVKLAGIAQGTFYIYYKSKNDIFVAVLENIREEILQKLIQVQKRNDLNAVEKLNLLIELEFNLNREQDELFLQMHLENNEGIHLKYIVSIINRLLPIYTAVIEQGVNEGRFFTKYPKEVAEYMLVATKMLFDPGIFPTSYEDLQIKMKATHEISERVLGATANSLNFPDITCFLKGEKVKLVKGIRKNSFPAETGRSHKKTES